jgi:hypothetical protein
MRLHDEMAWRILRRMFAIVACPKSVVSTLARGPAVADRFRPHRERSPRGILGPPGRPGTRRSGTVLEPSRPVVTADGHPTRSVVPRCLVGCAQGSGRGRRWRLANRTVNCKVSGCRPRAAKTLEVTPRVQHLTGSLSRRRALRDSDFEAAASSIRSGTWFRAAL